MAKTVIGAFDSPAAARATVDDLRNIGFSREISILAKKNGPAEGLEARGDIADGATAGGILGGATGLALAAGALAIPGLGPLVAAGPIAGVLAGAATGGLAGSLIDMGIPEQEGRRYEEDVRQGKTLVSVRSDETRVDQAAEILRNHGSQNVGVH